MGCKINAKIRAIYNIFLKESLFIYDPGTNINFILLSDNEAAIEITKYKQHDYRKRKQIIGNLLKELKT